MNLISNSEMQVRKGEKALYIEIEINEIGSIKIVKLINKNAGSWERLTK